MVVPPFQSAFASPNSTAIPELRPVTGNKKVEGIHAVDPV